MGNLGKRLTVLEQQVPAPTCHTCAERSAITIAEPGTPPAPCPECGAAPVVFTIAIDRATSWEGDAACMA